MLYLTQKECAVADAVRQEGTNIPEEKSLYDVDIPLALISYISCSLHAFHYGLNQIDQFVAYPLKIDLPAGFSSNCIL